MSKIDYIKNVQIIGMLNINGSNNKFVYKASNFPNDRLPHECIVRQVNHLNDEFPINTQSFMYTVMSDMTNNAIASYVSNNGCASICPNTTIQIRNSISGDITFELLAILPTGITPETEQTIITLNLDFIRYK